MTSSTATPAHAQTSAGSRLTAQVSSRTPKPRLGAPVTLVWDIRWTGLELLEGYLDIRLRDGRERLGDVRTDEMVLSTGRRRFETTLPIRSTNNFSSQLEIEVDFVTEERRFRLGSYLLFPTRADPYGSRTLTVAVCDPWQTAFSGRRARLVESLRLERFNPRQNDTSLVTSFGKVKPAEMPADPLGYCAYNVVLLADEGLTDLRPQQLDVLFQWVEAGGSLCVAAGGGLADHHLAFLNRLAANDEAVSPFLAGPDGRLMRDSAAGATEIRLLYPGMGRAAVVIAPPGVERDTDSAAWRRMVAFLWNVRTELVPGIVQDGQWEPGRLRRNVAQANPYYLEEAPVNAGQSFEYMPISEGNWLLDRLMPETVEVVPLSLIGLILIAYVLVIGPGDYLLLGLLRLRKLTWILFPVVTVGVTLFTVWLSHWYMQPSETRRTVQFLDVGSEGRLGTAGHRPKVGPVVRRSRFELLFTSTPREVTTDVAGEVFAPLDQQRFRAQSVQMYQQYQYGFELAAEEQLVPPAEYAGRIPSRYTVTQQIPQFTPQVNRFFSIAPKTERNTAYGTPAEGSSDAAGFNWHRLRPEPGQSVSTTMSDRNWREKVRSAVQRHFGNGAAIWLMHGDQVAQIAGDPALFSRRHTEWDTAYPAPSYYGPGPVPLDMEGRNYRNTDFLRQTCVRPTIGLFSLVTRIAPTGGDNFEDLAVLDPTDPNQWLLVVAVESSGDLLIYRKLYRTSQP